MTQRKPSIELVSIKGIQTPSCEADGHTDTGNHNGYCNVAVGLLGILQPIWSLVIVLQNKYFQQFHLTQQCWRGKEYEADKSESLFEKGYALQIYITYT